MLIYGNRQTLLGFVLTDDILIKKRFDVLRLWQIRPRRSCFRLIVVIDDLFSDINSFVANVNSRACDQFLDVIMRLAAIGATDKLFGYAKLGHRVLGY